MIEICVFFFILFSLHFNITTTKYKGDEKKNQSQLLWYVYRIKKIEDHVDANFHNFTHLNKWKEKDVKLTAAEK